MSPLLLRAGVRRLIQHPWQLLLSVLGVALGVGVVASIDLTSDSSRRAFLLSREAVAGRTTHHVLGGPSGIPEEIYRALRVDLGARPAAPVVAGDIVSAVLPDRALQLMGIDPLAEAPFRPYLVGVREARRDLIRAFLSTPRTVVLSAGLAADLGVAEGDTLAIDAGVRRRRVTVLGILRPEDDVSRQALSGLVITDISTAQELLGREGRLSRIDLILPEGRAGEAAAGRIRGFLPDGLDIEETTARSRTLLQMTEAFDLNLRALSLLALFVGMFLIFNTMTFSVLQRRPMIGTFRALGVTRREVFSIVLGEAALLGLVGTAFGLLLGAALAQGLIRLVTQTINDNYFVLTVRALAISPWWMAKGVVLGMGTTVASAMLPAWEATRTPPTVVQRRSSSEETARRVVPRSALLGTALAVLGIVLFLLPTRSLLVSLVALFAVILGCTFWTPAATLGILRVARPVAGGLFGVLGKVAVRSVTGSLSRTAVAIAALMMAVSVTVGVGIMVESLRGTVIHWLRGSLVADIFVSPSTFLAGRTEADLDPALVHSLEDVPGAEVVNTLRAVTVDSDGMPTRLLAFEMHPRGYGSFRFKSGDVDEAWEAFQKADAVLVSEPLAYHRKLEVGSALRLKTDGGPRRFRVAGVFYDYGSNQGVAMMSRETYLRHWSDDGISSAGVYLAGDADAARALAAIRSLPGGRDGVVVRSNRDVLRTSMDVFDRTFAVTGVLRLLATIVAFVGVLSALMALTLEQARDLAILRACGMTPRQLWRLLTSQTALMGLCAGLISIPVGIVMATILVHVINRRSFGWTLDLQISPGILLQALALAVVAAVLAGLYPAWKLSRRSPAAALREE